jgi:DNA-binding beta-propeller fold protein YncE
MRMTELFAIGGPRRLIVVLVGAISLASMSGGFADVVSGFGNAPFAPGRADDDHEGQRIGTVWVVNRDLGELAIFDAEGTLLKTLLVGAGAHDICISERAGKAYITAETINAVTTVDTETLVTDSIPVTPLPHHIEPSPDGRTIYVSLASHTPTMGSPQYAAIDTDDNSVTYVTTSHNASARSHGPHPSLDGDTLYVAHDIGDEVSGVDIETGNIDPSITPIVRAEEVIPTRFGHLLWASSRGDGTVKRIDLDTKTITASVPVGVQPESVMLTPSEQTLVVSLRGTPASVAFVDTVNLTLRGTVQIGGTGTSGDLGVITNNGRHVYATFDAGVSGTGGVAVIDVRTQTVVDTWAYPGTGRPHGIWYSRKKLRLPVDGN